MTTSITTELQWHSATSDQQISCLRCEQPTTRWIRSAPAADTWRCTCGYEFDILVEEIFPTIAYRVGRAVFTARSMAEQYADRSEPIEEIDLYNDIY